jgi:hypothetical protein
MRIGRLVASAAVLAGAVLLVSLPARGTEITRLDGAALADAESRARAALSSLAEGSAIVERTQAFTVGAAPRALQVLPVRYAPRAPGELRNVDHCALVVLSPDRVQVVRTVGAGYLESLGCTGLDAIGFSDLDGDGRLDIALIQATVAPPDRYLKTPVVVRTQPDGSLAVDDRLTEALDERGGITSIAALRRAVAERRARSGDHPADRPAGRPATGPTSPARRPQ